MQQPFSGSVNHMHAPTLHRRLFFCSELVKAIADGVELVLERSDLVAKRSAFLVLCDW